jgi:hypothetical protein
MAEALPQLPQACTILTQHSKLHTRATSAAATAAAAWRAPAHSAAAAPRGVAADDATDAAAGDLLGCEQLVISEAVQVQTACVVPQQHDLHSTSHARHSSCGAHPGRALLGIGSGPIRRRGPRLRLVKA